MKQKIRFLIFPLAIIGMFLMLTFSCNKKPVPVLNTTDVTSINLTVATSGGTITSDGGSIVTSRGVCWSKDTIPTIKDSFTSDGTGAGSFTSVITTLSPNTKYYLRAYATNSAGTGYGSTISFLTTAKLTDFDGNVYDTVRIGTQIWIKQNLKSTHYNNGDPIPNVTENKAWSKLKTGAFCDNMNAPDKSSTFGKLYNFYAVIDPRNLCPSGWHVPTDEEWTTLTTYLGDDADCYKLKEIDTTHLKNPVKRPTYESGFSAIPAGCRGSKFLDTGKRGYWWSASENNATTAWTRFITFNLPKVTRSHYYKISGFSVRCIKDK